MKPINTWIIDYEAALRLGFFLGMFALMAFWERRKPRRMLTQRKVVRWANNIALVLLNSVLVRLFFPVAGVGMALFAADQGWGVFHYVPIPFWAAVLLSIIFLDLIIYLQHVMFHAVPLLWRLHQVHHTDLDFDVTTGARFHPLEILLSMIIKFAAIGVLGPPVMAVVLFEVLLNAMAMFNHSNVALPEWLDGTLRRLIVTPDMHRVHHSVAADEANSNFGFNLSWWDRLFGTYRAQPRGGHGVMVIGLERFRAPGETVSLGAMLTMPWRGRMGRYPLNRRWE